MQGHLSNGTCYATDFLQIYRFFIKHAREMQNAAHQVQEAQDEVEGRPKVRVNAEGHPNLR